MPRPFRQKENGTSFYRLNMAHVFDLGSQYTHQIKRQIEELGFYCDEVAVTAKNIERTFKKYSAEKNGALILSGGPGFSNGIRLRIPEGRPVLGICLGMSLLSRTQGGTHKMGAGEFGRTLITLETNDPILRNLPRKFFVWMSHSESIKTPPPGFSVLATTERGYPAILKKDRQFLLQFHPEVSHTENGLSLLKNILEAFDEKKVKHLSLLERKVAEMKKNLKGSAVIAVSGGVDSTVVAVLAARALEKNKIHPFIIDTGFMRLGEIDEVRRMFRQLGIKLKVIKRSLLFIRKLKNVSYGEEKRKIIRSLFAKTIFEEFKKVRGEKTFLQGTLYPDVVESKRGRKLGGKIKSHHNVGGEMKMIKPTYEPFADLYKDQVRALGPELGVPRSFIEREPFPGPGLAIRIAGEITTERLTILKKADFVFRKIMKEISPPSSWQAFPVLIGIRTVGVKGDRRSFGYPLMIRWVKSKDGMTAEVPPVWDYVRILARKIPEEVPQICRVLLDMTTKPPSTIEWE